MSTSTLGLVLRLVVSLGIVLALMWLAARLVRGSTAGRALGVVELLARQPVGRGSSVAVLRVADRALVVGVTDTQVTLIGETDLATIEVAREQAEAAAAVRGTGTSAGGRPGTGAGGPLAGSVLSPGTWRRAIDAVRERTVRR